MPVDVEFAVETSQQKLCHLGLGFGVLFRIEASWPSFMCVAQGRGVAFAELSVGCLQEAMAKPSPKTRAKVGNTRVNRVKLPRCSVQRCQTFTIQL